MTPVNHRVLFESAPGLYLVLGPDLHILTATDAYLAATLTSRASIVGRHLFDVFPDNPSDPSATGVANLRASLERVLRDKRPDTMAVQKYDVQRADGRGFEERYWSPRNLPVLDAAGEVTCILHVVDEVTEFVLLRRHGDVQAAEIVRRGQELQEANRELRHLNATLEERIAERTAELMRTQEQMERARRLEAIGTLASGIAHDFNNLLTVISGYSDLLLEEFGDGHPARAPLTDIQQAGHRAAALTRQLLVFSRQQVIEPRIVSLNAIVTQAERLLRRIIGEDVTMLLALDPEIGPVRADAGQLEQVVMNLAVNARDAMPEGGTLVVSTAATTIDRAGGSVPPGRYVRLTVSDTGCGMTEEVKARIFEPFFTTKPMGKGTGLGLATVFGIVQDLAGVVHVDTAPGRGTTFQVMIPVTVGAIDAPLDGATARARGSETILLVEDDDAVRGLSARALRSAGYRVLEASNGREALRISAEHDGVIALLLTDVIMPGISGRKVAEAVLETRPATRVLYVSGYTDDAVLRHGIATDEVAFLHKPFTSSAMLRKVQEVLAHR